MFSQSKVSEEALLMETTCAQYGKLLSEICQWLGLARDEVRCPDVSKIIDV